MSVNANQFLVITTSLFLFNQITIHHASGQAMDYPPLWTSPRIPSAHIQTQSVPFITGKAITNYSNYRSLEVEQKERFRHAEELIENLKDQFNERTGSFKEELSRLHAQLKEKQDELKKTNQKAAELQIELEKSIKINRALATLAFFGQKPKSEIDEAAEDKKKID